MTKHKSHEKRWLRFSKGASLETRDGAHPYTRGQLERMDAKFTSALETAIRGGTESAPRGKAESKT
jgi:hypothetical protein